LHNTAPVHDDRHMAEAPRGTELCPFLSKATNYCSFAYSALACL
jgi:hypothetical protein